MTPGKACSQSGHAFIGAYMKSSSERQRDYHADGIGTKVCLRISNLEKLYRLYQQAQDLGIPSVLIEDSGRNTTFNGVPTISAVGVGPIMRHEFPALRKIPLCP